MMTRKGIFPTRFLSFWVLIIDNDLIFYRLSWFSHNVAKMPFIASSGTDFTLLETAIALY